MDAAGRGGDHEIGSEDASATDGGHDYSLNVASPAWAEPQTVVLIGSPRQ
jgi:hypothetical protein